MSIKFAGKPHLIFMVKTKGLEDIFSENIILLKDRDIEMFALKPEKPVTEICGKLPFILLVKLKVLRKIFLKIFLVVL